MLNRTAVINIVGLTESLVGPRTPRIDRFRAGGKSARIIPAFPAVTCTAQANYLTGTTPSRHGIVANGWYDRQLAETHFWKQSNRLVAGAKIWDEMRRRDPKFTCAQLFWWFNMYSTADYSITPRPAYPADGRKVFDIYSWPPDIRPEIKKALGEFPFPAFWGPAAGVDGPQGSADAASRWIAESAKWIEQKYSPTLSLIYIPHLDYNLQRLGPSSPKMAADLRQVDDLAGDLISFFQKRGVQVVLLSEYGITDVRQPIHLNRIFRKQGWIAIREELGLELLDCGASKVFAVADHQVAHIYFNDPSLESRARDLILRQTGVESVLGAKEKMEMGIDHLRAGDLIAVAAKDAWFTYYYWLDDAVAPDFARCVDIHRKPGYDPVELFLNPEIPGIKLKIAWRLLQKKLGFRMLMDVVPLDASLVRGSHGRRTDQSAEQPLLICERSTTGLPSQIESTEVFSALINQM
ncbi:MAG TPA: nucleotide pyrophosphatase/phosphodiesterase family protein [Verrucomicrobiae bacterium]|nr:nucleotide pyrophosphatase/phosphodiesterase family protein [Verrucomicrobiae bacterium]